MRRAFLASTVAIGLICVGALTPAARASRGVSREYQKLAGTTVMKADSASVAHVLLSKDVKVWHPWFDPDRPDFTIQGGRGAVLFALVGEDADEPRLLLGGRLPEEADSSPFLTHFGLGPEGPDWSGYWDVPAGRYRLYLFTSRPATLTLSLDGVAGRSRVVPRRDARYEARTPRPVAETGAVNNLYFAGAEGSLEGQVAQLQILWKHETLHASTHSGYCWYDDVPMEPNTAYVPGCPTADSQDVVELTGVWAGNSLSVGTALRLAGATGESGQGAWFTSAAAVTDFGHVAAWLDLGL